jgi:predicted dienelactone hydrolase
MIQTSIDYDPFSRGLFPVGVRTIEARDTARDRVFPCEIWYPAAGDYAGRDIAPDTQDIFDVAPHQTKRRQSAVRDARPGSGLSPLILFSHSSAGGRRSASFLCTHLSSHGYVVAALDHSELIAPDLAPSADETASQRAARIEALIASRVPDACFLLDLMTSDRLPSLGIGVDPALIGIVGHSLGGWTALSTTEADRRIRATVALAPGGASRVKPGILPLELAFDWGRDVPVLYVVAENDVSLPLDGMVEIFERTPATKQMVILRKADHFHFVDDVEIVHEAIRQTAFAGELAWIPREMKPISDLSTGSQAHLAIRGLTLCHFDAWLKERADARAVLSANLEAELLRRGVSVGTYDVQNADT